MPTHFSPFNPFAAKDKLLKSRLDEEGSSDSENEEFLKKSAEIQKKAPEKDNIKTTLAQILEDSEDKDSEPEV